MQAVQILQQLSQESLKLGETLADQSSQCNRARSTSISDFFRRHWGAVNEARYVGGIWNLSGLFSAFTMPFAAIRYLILRSCRASQNQHRFCRSVRRKVRFSASKAHAEAMEKAAEEDYQKVSQAYADPQLNRCVALLRTISVLLWCSPQ